MDRQGDDRGVESHSGGRLTTGQGRAGWAKGAWRNRGMTYHDGNKGTRSQVRADGLWGLRWNPGLSGFR